MKRAVVRRHTTTGYGGRGHIVSRRAWWTDLDFGDGRSSRFITDTRKAAVERAEELGFVVEFGDPTPEFDRLRED